MADMTNVTTLVNGDVFDPQVVSDMINAKVEKKAVMKGYVKVNTDLQGVPGSEVTIPRWGYIGEAVDLVKKHVFHDHELDKEHLAKELGDVAWYLAVTAHAIGYDLETVLQMNVDKLLCFA